MNDHQFKEFMGEFIEVLMSIKKTLWWIAFWLFLILITLIKCSKSI